MEGRISALILLCLVLSGVGALQVNIPQELYEYARGDNITLPCSFTPKTPLKGTELVIISWYAEAAEAGAEENRILSYYSLNKELDITPPYEGRVSLDVDVLKGKADLKLSSITLADNKEFQCSVQIPGDDEGKLTDKARLVVLVAPSTPICKIQGKVESGENINLTCLSEEGLPTPTYRWEGPRTTERGGVLSLYDISRDTSGYYICTSINKIHSATCNITLSVHPLIAPSTPICKIQGKVEYGQNVNLTCVSERGSPQPTYKWESRDVKNTPHAADLRTTDKGGSLSLYDISTETSGFYICTSSNKIRSATCNITLSVMPPSTNTGPTARIICGVIATLIILIIVVCCYCKKKKV